MIDDEDEWESPDAEYHNEVAVCHHGIPKGAGCEWCEEEKEDES